MYLWQYSLFHILLLLANDNLYKILFKILIVVLSIKSYLFYYLILMKKIMRENAFQKPETHSKSVVHPVVSEFKCNSIA
jgi:hypothetical protein